jgi:hypothetical protein
MANAFKNGSIASFNVADVVCPDLLQITNQIGPELEISGEVDYLSDGGDPSRKFAVINVPGIYAPLIVPVERLRALAEKSPAPKFDRKPSVARRAEVG